MLLGQACGSPPQTTTPATPTERSASATPTSLPSSTGAPTPSTPSATTPRPVSPSAAVTAAPQTIRTPTATPAPVAATTAPPAPTSTPTPAAALSYRAAYTLVSIVTDAGQYGGSQTYTISVQVSVDLTLTRRGALLIGGARPPVVATVAAQSTGIKAYQGRLSPDPCPDITTGFTPTGTDIIEVDYYDNYGPTGRPQVLLPKVDSSLRTTLSPRIDLAPSAGAAVCPNAASLTFTGTAYTQGLPLADLLPADDITNCCDKGYLFDASGGTKVRTVTKTGVPGYSNNSAVRSTASLTVTRLTP